MLDFFQLSPIPSNAIEGYYDFKLVLISFLVAIFASYVALTIAGGLRVYQYERRNFWIWFLSGALVMGMGIWTMHFIGMEAFIMNMPTYYDMTLTFLSLLIAVIASGFALYFVVVSPKVMPSNILFAGTLMGLAIVSMHYVGMSAIMHMHIRYIPSLFFLSILIAVVASQAALWLMIKSYEYSSITRFNLLSAIVMGCAICGMHYVGMAAAVMTPLEATMDLAPTHSGLPPYYLGVTASLIMIIFLAVSSNNQRYLLSLQQINENLLKKEIELRDARTRAEQANVAKSCFLANMSHEIRTPLNVIVGSASLLARSDQLNDKERKYIDRICLSSRILLNLIMDILDFSKIEAGELKLNETQTEFISLVKEVISVMNVKADEKHLTLSLNCENTPASLKIISDPIRIQQIITNLIANAIKFTEKGSVTVKIFSKDIDPDHISIRLEVQDTGIGISEDQHHLLFRKFSQLDDSTTRKFGGTGLGLAISKELIKLLGGEIGFSSKERVGSTFWMEVPFLIDHSVDSAEKPHE